MSKVIEISEDNERFIRQYLVAPLAGARIEIRKEKVENRHDDGRSPRGSAD